MSNRTKQVLAGALVLGVAGVWGSRMTGFTLPFVGQDEPLAFEPVPSDAPGVDVPGEPTLAPSPAEAGLSVEAIVDLVQFLESRESGRGTHTPEPVVVTGDVTPDVPEETLAPTRDLGAVLERHPLYAVAQCSRGGSATFGHETLRVGDRLPASEFTVVAIETGAVRLASPDGDYVVELPPLGGGTARAARIGESAMSQAASER